jgi:hypothetical protein
MIESYCLHMAVNENSKIGLRACALGVPHLIEILLGKATRERPLIRRSKGEKQVEHETQVISYHKHSDAEQRIATIRGRA